MNEELKDEPIIKFSELPRKGLIADFSEIAVNQLVEFYSDNFNELNIFELQMEHIKERAEKLGADIGVYCIGGNSNFDNYLIKFYKKEE